MNGLGVSQLADAAGVAPSTVRFYERVGLISPARRAPNGYRVFDESSLDELEFVGRAKGIGMSLEDIGGLMAVWSSSECRSLQARLCAFLVERTAEVRCQIAELRAFERQLQTVLGRLAVRDPGPERCGASCGCEADLDMDSAPRPDDADARAAALGVVAAPVCSLDAESMNWRLGEWRAAAAAARTIERTADAVRLVLPREYISVLAELCAAETACCPQSRFVIEVGNDGVTLTAQAPGDPAFLDLLFPSTVAGSG